MISTIVERDLEYLKTHGFIEFNNPVDFMHLTLTYRGPLHAQSSGDSRREEKQDVRRQFHKQILDLWETHLALDGIIAKWRTLNKADQIRNGDNDFVTAYDIGRFRFVPLVTKRSFLCCELDILFLRKEPAGYIIDRESGDIDNRLKVLFDALRMPKEQEIPDKDWPYVNENPFFCLLEDDALITGFRIETDRLLYPPPTSDAEVALVIRTKIKIVKLTYANMGLGGD